MRSPASSTSPQAPSKPTSPASCESSAPETASRSPCGPTRPAASDAAQAPAAVCRNPPQRQKRRVPLGGTQQSLVADRVVQLARELVALAELGLRDVADARVGVVADRRAQRGREQEEPERAHHLASVGRIGDGRDSKPGQEDTEADPASRPA